MYLLAINIILVCQCLCIYSFFFQQFVNRVTELTHMDELEELVHKLRMSANTGDMLPSTPHAVIRTMLSLGHTDDLLRILNDRLNYGVFPDYYCSNLLMDTFLKNKNYRGMNKFRKI